MKFNGWLVQKEPRSPTNDTLSTSSLSCWCLVRPFIVHVKSDIHLVHMYCINLILYLLNVKGIKNGQEPLP